jgi:HK97 family phage major capsid protein
MTFGSLNLDAQKAVSYLVISDELARSANPASITLLGSELARAVALQTDLVFLNAIAASAVLTHAATGTTATAFLFDLDSALQAMQLGANSKIYFIAGADVIKKLAMTLALTGSPTVQLGVTGGTVAGIRFVVSNAAADVAYVIDASQIAADSDVIMLDRSSEASIQMDSAPSTPPSGANVVSLWQQNLVALRAERYFGVQLLRSTGAACISGMSTTA